MRMRRRSEAIAESLRPNPAETQQIELALAGPDKFGTFFDQQVKYWAKVVKDSGIQLN